MICIASAPFRVEIESAAESRPAEAVAVYGQWIALRGDRPVRRHDAVRVHLHWDGGAVTTLPGLVRTSTPVGLAVHLTHVDVHGVEGDWDTFLRYLGTRFAASAVA